MTLTIGIDVGGTKVLGGVVTPEGKILATTRKDTAPQGGAAAVSVIAEVAKELMQSHDISAVGVSVPGFISSDRARVIGTPNISGWNDLAIADTLGSLIGVDVVVENDANAALWGEYKFGAGQGRANICMLTLGTGVGGGVITNGQLYRGAFGMGAELGHIRLIPEGRQCGCGAKGCLEQYGSGSALVRIARERAAANLDKAQFILSLGGSSPDQIRGEDITKAANSGDVFSKEIFEEVGESVGAALATICAVLDPSHIIIGGGVAEAGEILLEPIRKSMVRNTSFSGLHPFPEVIRAQLGDMAGLVGLSDLARIK
jgi:glucokinase